MMSFNEFLDFVQAGEPVSAGVTNRAARQTDQNVRYIREWLQAIDAGSTVYMRQQTIVSTADVGQPVYFDTTTQQFELAFAATVTDTETGYLTIADSSQVWGIVASKSNDTLADILLFGVARLDIAAATGEETAAAGTWYLSGRSEGALTRQQPPVSVPVLRSDGNGTVFVNPQLVDFVENHRHYSFDLLMQPAGVVSPPTVGNPHTITAADPLLRGWLPADHASFAGTAPPDAKFGYNLAADPALNSVWPPIPLQSVSVEMQRPSIWDTDTERKWYASQLTSETIVADRYGIWWLSDCYDEVPWPTDLDSDSSSSVVPGPCEAAGKAYVMRLFFARVGFATDNTIVRSLVSRDARLIVTCDGTDDVAATGDLAIDLDLSLMLGATDVTGPRAFKTFDPASGTFGSGPITEGVYASSDNVFLTSSLQTVVAGKVVHHGPVGIGVSSQATQELASKLVRLDGATEESYPVLYVGLPGDSQSRYVVQFEIPADSPTDISFSLRLRLLGRSAGTLPPLTVEYFRTARPTNGLVTPVNVSEAYSPLTITTAATLVSANQAVEANSEPVTVLPGDIVHVRVTRTPSDVGDTYAAEMGVMQQIGVVASN